MSSLSSQKQQHRDEIRQRLAVYGQEHILRFSDVLSDDVFQKLAEDVAEVDFDQLSQIVELSLAPASTTAPAPPVPLPSSSMFKTSQLTADKRSELFAAGLQHIAASSVALIILAGGQGTRLGSEDPKGCYNIGLPSQHSLFQLQIARTLKLSALAGGGCVPIYIMTSPMTHSATIKFFESNDFFGCSRCDTRSDKLILKSDDSDCRAAINFFQQGIFKSARTWLLFAVAAAASAAAASAAAAV
jgi:UDP-N-acetylglucosamine/UDP-N-acetylgalactosamine diphosphorylase